MTAYKGLSRRDFLKFTGLSLSTLALSDKNKAIAGEAQVQNSHYPYRNWEDIYKQTLSWDSISYAFHCVNCKGNCAWKVYVKDGVVIREEQVAEYPQINPHIPDANPRGCNKGAVHSDSMYSLNRIKYPLKRAGKRGEGKWKRISWDQALEEIAEKMVDTILTNDDLRSANDYLIRKSAIVNHKSINDHGLSSLMFHIGTGILSQGRRAGPLRLGSLLGAIRSYSASAVGDMFPGATLVFGTQLIGGTSDSWFECDYIILWCVNPMVSRIPDAHFLNEARYRGCKMFSIAPDYNPSSIHADIWIPIRVGMDSLLAMSLINVILILLRHIYLAKGVRL